MRVLITGASGNVGCGMTELLADSHELVLHDLNHMPTDLPFHQGDIQIGWNLRPAVEGCDAVIHTPAWHGIHSGIKTEADFWRLNCDGTFYLLEAAARAGVKKVVCLSSVAWYSPYEKYGFTKRIGEELCEYFRRQYGMHYAAIRPHNFTPWTDFLKYGQRMLYGGVDRRDVLQAIRLALEGNDYEPGGYRVEAECAFPSDVDEAWQRDPLSVIERQSPGKTELVRKYGLDLSRPLNRPDVSETKRQLGWQPRYNFLTFLDELAERDAAGTVAEATCGY